MFGTQSQAFSVRLFSPKLWTALNQYGAGGPCVTDLYELLLGIELEGLSLGRKLRFENSMRLAQFLTPVASENSIRLTRGPAANQNKIAA
jgi:hypothetical protein